MRERQSHDFLFLAVGVALGQVLRHRGPRVRHARSWWEDAADTADAVLAWRAARREEKTRTSHAGTPERDAEEELR